MEIFILETDASSGYETRIKALEDKGSGGDWILYKTVEKIDYSASVNVSNYYNSSAKLAKLVFTGSSLSTHNSSISVGGFISPTVELQLGTGRNYKDSTIYYTVLQIGGTIYIPSTYYSASLSSTEFTYGY